LVAGAAGPHPGGFAPVAREWAQKAARWRKRWRRGSGLTAALARLDEDGAGALEASAPGNNGAAGSVPYGTIAGIHRPVHSARERRRSAQTRKTDGRLSAAVGYFIADRKP